MSKIYPTPRISPNSHFNTDKLMDLSDQTGRNAETETIFTCLEKSARCRTVNAASYSTNQFNKLCFRATQNLNSCCPWSSKRETHGVHRFSVLHCCLSSESKALFSHLKFQGSFKVLGRRRFWNRTASTWNGRAVPSTHIWIDGQIQAGNFVL